MNLPSHFELFMPESELKKKKKTLPGVRETEMERETAESKKKSK